MDDTEFDDAPGNKKNLRVFLVNPPSGDNPWRTQGDYQDDQRRLLSAYRWTIASATAAIISALCALAAVLHAFTR